MERYDALIDASTQPINSENVYRVDSLRDNIKYYVMGYVDNSLVNRGGDSSRLADFFFEHYSNTLGFLLENCDKQHRSELVEHFRSFIQKIPKTEKYHIVDQRSGEHRPLVSYLKTEVIEKLLSPMM